MGDSFMAQSVSFVDTVCHQKEVASIRCELPSAADPSINQILYVNIGEVLFLTYYNIDLD